MSDTQRPQENGQAKAKQGMKEALVDPKTIKVDAELHMLVPQHRKSEVALLERSLVEAKGCRDALIVWQQEAGKLVLLDGHTRRQLCIEHGFKVPIRVVQLPDKEAAKAYVKQIQLGRRNTPDHAESYLRGSHYNELKQGRGGDRRSKDQADPLKSEAKDQADPLKDDTAEKLAKEYEVGSATIKRDAQFARLLDAVLKQCEMEDKRWQVLGGDIHLNRSAVKKLSQMTGRQQKKAIEHLLKHGKLPRAGRADSRKASGAMTAKNRATALVKSLKRKDEKLPVAVLKELASLLGYRVAEKSKSS
jgi:hypothetical protein